MAERFVFFYGTASPFSNWHPCSFVLDGVRYSSSEQAYMHLKARCFGDEEHAALIMRTTSPRTQKQLGRRVRGFVQATWDAQCRRHMRAAVGAKFRQNPTLRAALLATAGATLVEASPRDRVWGIGLGASNPRAATRATWLGSNWLGQILTELREELLRELMREPPAPAPVAAAAPAAPVAAAAPAAAVAPAPAAAPAALEPWLEELLA